MEYDYDQNARWYIVHTYSGHEDKVGDKIRQLIESNNLGDNILRVEIPIEEELVEKNGKKKLISRKKFSTYVFLKAVLTRQIWFLITNISGCTGFCGPNGRPLPMSDDEVRRLGLEVIQVEDLDIAIGDNVRIISGHLENFIGEVIDINPNKQKVKVLVSMFEQKTPIELDFFMVEKI